MNVFSTLYLSFNQTKISSMKMHRNASRRCVATWHNPELNSSEIHKKNLKSFLFWSFNCCCFFVVTRTRIAWQFPMIIVTLKVLSITRKSAHSIWGITFEKESTDCMWNYYFKRDTIQTSTDMSRDRQKDKEHWVSYLRNMFFTGVSIWSLQPLHLHLRPDSQN